MAGKRAVVVGAIVALLGACAGEPPAVEEELAGDGTEQVAEPDTAWQQQGGPLVIGRIPVLTDSTIALAEQNGWFEEYGLEVEVFEGRNTQELVPAFLAGEIDAMVGGLQPGVVAAIAEGAPIRAVSLVQTLDPEQCSNFGLVMLPDAAETFDATDADAVRSLRIGGPFTSGFIARWGMERLAGSVGLTVEDLDLTTVAIGDAAAALAGGQVDAVVTVDPTKTLIHQQLGGVEVLSLSELVPDRPFILLYFGPRLLEDRELAARYLAVHMLAIERHAEGATEENVAAVTGPTGLAPELLSEMCWTVAEPASRPYEDAVVETLAFAQSVGELEVVPAPEEMWDHEVHDLAIELLRTSR